MPDIKTFLYLEPFSKKKHCILQRNLDVILSFKHRMGGLIDGRNDSMFLLKQCQVFIYFLILIYICLESLLLKISMNSLCPRNTNMHGTLIPIPSPKLTALPSMILTLQSLCSHLRYKY